MCDNVVLHDQDRTATSQGELAAIIGLECIVLEKDAEFHEGDCLCPVDLPASAERAGYEHSRLDADGEFDAFDYHWRKKAGSI